LGDEPGVTWISSIVPISPACSPATAVTSAPTSAGKWATISSSAFAMTIESLPA
jgi:hypothetical protein